MDEYENLGTYNGDTEHDMWVDFDNYENIGPSIFSNKITLMSLSETLMTGISGN